ncbi:MAG: YigZ family protein [Eubacteriales bacterium]|nr:YigZ family protein [Eubacteriales bacterium]
MNDYITVNGAAEASLTEKKSVFIANISPVTTDEDAVAFINAVKRKYPDAKHNVYAYVLRDGSSTRYSDDREPSGTAGMPVLDTIRKSGITDTAIVVTRYFGGILLGTGGLVRAYSAAAKKAIEAAHICKREIYAEYSVQSTYTDYQKILPIISDNRIKISDTTFSDSVRLVISFPKTKESDIVSKIKETTFGRSLPLKISEKYDFSEV